MSLLKKLLSYDVIFVDYFDTTVFRYVHSHQIYGQWAKQILARCSEIGKFVDAKTLVRNRWSALPNLRKHCDEPTYEELIQEIYEQCNLKASGITLDYFLELSYSVDLGVELGCQYKNEKVVQTLNKLKEAGKKIYLVSDFYMPRKSYDAFFKALGIDHLFDGMFVSSECNASKRTGALYQHVLKALNVEPTSVAMVGDSLRDDVLHAKQNGISGFRYFPILHKIQTNISKRFKIDFSSQIVAKKGVELYRNSYFEEYVVVLYAFIQRLYGTAKKYEADKLAFLSRGGSFLKTLFDEYQKELVPENERIESAYCLNSRKVCFAARDDEKSKRLLLDYLKNFKSEKGLFLVDEGWYNHSQQTIASISGWDTFGFYIGSRRKESLDITNQCVRKGLLFDMGPKKPNTKYYGILCTNCSMYEQILTAAHGSVDFYYEEDGVVKAGLKTNEKEMYLYDKYIRNMQERMLLHFKGLCAWNGKNEITLKECAQLVLKSVIFNSNARCKWLNELDNNRYDNCSMGKARDKSVKDVKINPFELILHPDRYLGMFCKLQRKIYDKSLLNVLYYPIAFSFYAYTRLLSRL